MSSVPSNLIPTRITQLQDAPVASEDGLLLYVYEGNTYKIRAGDLLNVAGVPTTRNVNAGTGLAGGGQLAADVTLSVAVGGIGTTQLAVSGVTAGTYGSSTSVPIVTVDATGRVMAATTAAVTVTGYVPETRQVIAGAGLSGGGTLNNDVTLIANLSNAAPASGYQVGASGVATDITRSDHTHPAVNLAIDNEVDGLLGLSNGGTARSLVAAAGAPVWSGADGLYIGSVGLAGQVLVSGGADAPTWGSAMIISDQPANVVYAGPASGPDAPSSFRALVTADLPVGTGTVTAVSELTLGTTGTDLTSTVANGSTTPVITLNVPTASATNRGALSAADWSTFNSKLSDFGNQLANVVYAGPVGASGPPSFRALSAVDIPTLDQNTTGTASNVTGTVAIANGGTGETTSLAAFDALSPMTTAGDVLYGGVAGSATRLAIGSANTVIHGGLGGPTYSAVVEADISLSANTINDVSTAKHGFCPVLSNNANQFLNGQGNYSIPSGLTISASYSATSFAGQTTVSVTHNFGTYPLVQVIDNTGAVLIPLSIINNTINDFTVTFNANTTGTIMASVGSPQPQAVITIAIATYTVLASDRIVKVTAPGCVITLPTSVGNTGREFNIVNASSGTISVVGTSSQTISTQLAQVLPTYSAMSVFADGANYWII